MKRNHRILPQMVIGVAALAATTSQLAGYDRNQAITETNGRHTISAGGSHTLAIIPLNPDSPEDGGRLYAWGDNQFGQLGDGTFNNPIATPEEKSPARFSPRQIGTGESWVLVAAGTSHSLAIRADGSLWAWGDNDFGQLGIGNRSNSNEPTQVGTSTDWNAIAAGDDFSVAINDSGVLYTWGSNANGRAGHSFFGDSTGAPSANDIYLEPEIVSYIPRSQSGFVENSDEFGWNPTDVAVAIAAGGNHGMVIDSTGELYVWGENERKTLADGTRTYIYPSFRKIRPTSIGTDPWISMAVNGNSAFGILDDTPLVPDDGGLLYGWGAGEEGKLGIGNTSPQVPNVTLVNSSARYTKVTAGPMHALALEIDDDPTTVGVLETFGVGFGRNVMDELITDPDPNGTLGIPVRDEAFPNLLNRVFTEETPIPFEYPTGTFMTNVEAGAEFSHFAISNSTLRSTGLNNSGQLGNGRDINIDDINTPSAGRPVGSTGFGNADMVISTISTPLPEISIIPQAPNPVMNAFSVSATVANEGTALVDVVNNPAPLVDFYLSLDTIFQSGTDLPLLLTRNGLIGQPQNANDVLTSKPVSADILSGESGSVSGRAVLAAIDGANIVPVIPASGQYRVLARVDEVDNRVEEISEDNNESTNGSNLYDILADLTVTVDSVTQNGDDIDFNITVTNEGEGAIVDSLHTFTIEIYAGFNPTLSGNGSGDTLFGEFEWPQDLTGAGPHRIDPAALAATPADSQLVLNESDFFDGGIFPTDLGFPFQLTADNSIPANQIQQGFYLIALADSEDEILEDKEFNNQGSFGEDNNNDGTVDLLLGDNPLEALDLVDDTGAVVNNYETFITDAPTVVYSSVNNQPDGSFGSIDLVGATGDDALRTPALDAGQEAGIGFEVTGPAFIEFDWLAIANAGELSFLIDGGPPDPEFPNANKFTGSDVFETAIFVVPAGTHFVEWRFKQLSGEDRTDFALIDNIVFTEITSADLILDGLTFSLPENTSDPRRLSVTVSGVNQGADTNLTVPELENFRIDIALSLDGSLGDEDEFLGSIPLDNIAGGSSFIFNNIEFDPDANDIIENLPVGTWNLIAYIDPPTSFVAPDGGLVTELDEENNEILAVEQVTIEELIDIRANSITVDQFSPTLQGELEDTDGNVFANGDLISGTFTLSRTGIDQDLLNQPFTVDIVISTDRTIETGDFRLLRVPFDVGDFGQSIDWTAELPDLAPYGDFVSVGIIVDPDGEIQEFDETNNTALTSNTIFLTEITLLTAIDLDGVEGDPFQPPQLFNSLIAQAQGATAPFFGQSAFTNDGIDAAQSAPIDNNETAAFEVTFTPTQTTIISFNWAVISEEPSEDSTIDNPGDVFRFLIDGQLAGTDAEISGIVDWEARSYTIPASDDAVRLRWEFVKDAAVSLPNEGAFVDNIITTSPNLELEIAQPFGPGLDAINGTGTFTEPTFAIPGSGFFLSGDGPFQVDITVANIGNAPIAPDQNIFVELRLSADTNFDDSDIELQNDFPLSTGQIVVNTGLLPSETTRFPVTFNLPENIAIPQDFYLVGKVDIVDPDVNEVGAVAESSETDNEFSSVDSIFPVRPTISIDEAIDFLTEFFPWVTGGDGTFFGQAGNVSIDGADAVTTSTLDANSGPASSFLETRLQGPSQLEFFWRTSSPSGDTLNFSISGETLGSIAGDTDWEFTEGTYSLTYDRSSFITINYNASAADIQTAINAFFDDGDGNTTDPTVTVASLPTTYPSSEIAFEITYDQLGDQEQIIVDPTSLGIPVTVDVVTATNGDAGTQEVQQVSISTRQRFFLPAGQHTVRFTYTKNSSQAIGPPLLDSAFIDLFSQSPVSEPDLLMTSISAPAGDYIVNEIPIVDGNTVVEKGILPITLSAANRGATVSSFNDATADVELRLSTDLIWGNEDDVIIGNFLSVEGLIIGGNSAFLDGNFPIPEQTPEGQYYLSAYVDYLDAEITEFNESNVVQYTSTDNNLLFTDSRDINIRRLPNLVVAQDSVIVDVSKLYYGGDSIRLRLDLANIGLGDYDGLVDAEIKFVLHAIGVDAYPPTLPLVDGPPEGTTAQWELATLTFSEELPGVSPSLAQGSRRTIDTELVLPAEIDLYFTLIGDNGTGSLSDFRFVLDVILDEEQTIEESNNVSHFTLVPTGGIIIGQTPAEDSAELFIQIYDLDNDGDPSNALTEGQIDSILMADDDGDGLVNLLEYAFNRSPVSNSVTEDTRGLLGEYPGDDVGSISGDADGDADSFDPAVLDYGMTRIGLFDFLRVTFDLNNRATDLTYTIEQGGGAGFSELISLRPPYDGSTAVVPPRETLAELVNNNDTVTAASEQGLSARVTVRDNIPANTAFTRILRLIVTREPTP